MIVKMAYGEDSVLPAAHNQAADQLAILLSNSRVTDLSKIQVTTTVTRMAAMHEFIVAHTVIIQRD